MLWLKTTLVISFCLVSNLTANPVDRFGELDSVLEKDFQTLHGSRSQFTTPNTNEELCNSSDRPCKLHRRTQDFYIWRARPLALIFPAPQAATVLRGFYHAVLTQVNEQWSLNAPVPALRIHQGNLELFFCSVGGPIPWSVVARLAYKMLCATELGWIGTYEVIYQNGVADRAVGVTLRVINNQLSTPQNRLTKSKTVNVAKRTELNKRSQVNLTSFKIHGAILPISIAAPYVKAFFDAIAFDASNAWTSRREAALLTVTRGSLQLTMSCLGAPIPWRLLVSVAQKFSALADHSWVGIFDAIYEEPESAIMVALSLRLLRTATASDSTIISRIRDLQSQNPPTTSTTPRVSARGPTTPMSPGLRVTSFVRTAAIVPSTIAAAKLEDFYTIIATKIETGQLATRIPSRTMVCSLWDFELTFSCDSIDVPLSFVQAFAIDMAEWSSRQFTGFYEATVRGEGPLAGLVILVQMRLKGSGKGSQSSYFM